MQIKKSIKLHLGCQNNYLEGYVNVDLPPSEQTVEKVRADVYEDVRRLSYPDNTIDEIRSHHLLEHFSRQEALLLLARWHRWLKKDGLLVVETPDFETSIKKFIKADNIKDRFPFGRHIFGSQEAAWAQHQDFWYEDKFRYVLSQLGYGDFRFEEFSNNLEQKLSSLKKIKITQESFLKNFKKMGFNDMPNVICLAKKVREDIDYEMVIYNILSLSLVGREKAMLDIWMRDIFGKV